jgi:Glycerophosphoryl diester phosphodiesterase family
VLAILAAGLPGVLCNGVDCPWQDVRRRRMASDRRHRIGGVCALTVAMGVAGTMSGTASARAAGGGEVVAHNGGTAWAPESTLAAFGHDIDVGAYGIEFAVRFSSDGVPVVIHDATLDRTTNCTGNVAEHTYGQLEQCDAGVGYPGGFAHPRIPSLDQTLSYIGRRSDRIKLFVHVKLDDAGQIRLVLARLRCYGLAGDRTTLIGSTEAILATMRAAGVKRLGYVFNDPSGWSTDYPVLIPYDVPPGRVDVQRAERRGQQVFPVEDHPFELADLADRGATGLLANDVDAAIRLSRGADGGDSDRRSGGGGGGSF